MNKTDLTSYKKKYYSIKNSIINAYIDYYILEGIEKLDPIRNGNEYSYKSSYPVLQHIADLCKMDFAICICKVDRDPKGLTLNGLFKFLKAKGFSVSYDIDENNDSIKDTLWDLRCKSFAHDDGIRLNIEVSIDQIKPYLDLIKDCFNRMCFSEVDPNIVPISQKELMSISMTYSLGMGNMIQGVTKDKG